MQTCRPGHPLQKRSEVLLCFLHILSSRWRTRSVSLCPLKASALRWDSSGASQNHVKHTKHVFELVSKATVTTAPAPAEPGLYCRLQKFEPFAEVLACTMCPVAALCRPCKSYFHREQKQVQLKHPDGGHTGTGTSAPTAQSRAELTQHHLWWQIIHHINLKNCQFPSGLMKNCPFKWHIASYTLCITAAGFCLLVCGHFVQLLLFEWGDTKTTKSKFHFSVKRCSSSFPRLTRQPCHSANTTLTADQFIRLVNKPWHGKWLCDLRSS